MRSFKCGNNTRHVSCVFDETTVVEMWINAYWSHVLKKDVGQSPPDSARVNTFFSAVSEAVHVQPAC